MTLPSSGAISLDDVQNEFGGTNPIQIDEYYSAADGVPASGTISLSDFYGKSSGPVPGQLWVWGENYYGYLADNTTTNKNTPVTTFAGGSNWKQVSCGVIHAAAIKIDGTLWTWGNNDYGKLGDNTGIDRSTPVTTFAGGTDWEQVSCGLRHTAAIKTDGTLWIWGSNYGVGSLGNNSQYGLSCTPITTFAGGNNWKQVSCGYHTGAIKTDGTLWVWGYGGLGALGVEPDPYYGTKRVVPVTTFAGGTNWKQVFCSNGSNYSVTAAIKTDGTLWVWGDNSYGLLGINDLTETQRNTPVTTFAGGTNWNLVAGGSDRHMAAIKTDGTLWMWGRNNSGQLANNSAVGVEIPNYEEPVTINARFTPITTFAGGTNWKQVVCGQLHTAAIKNNGTLWVWGNNAYYGQLGFINTPFTFSTTISVSGTVTLTPPYYSTLTTTNTGAFVAGTGGAWTVTTSPYNAELTGTYQIYVAAVNQSIFIQPLVTASYTGTLTFSQSGTTTPTVYSTPVTTFAGGNTWKQVSSTGNYTAAIKPA